MAAAYSNQRAGYDQLRCANVHAWRPTTTHLPSAGSMPHVMPFHRWLPVTSAYLQCQQYARDHVFTDIAVAHVGPKGRGAGLQLTLQGTHHGMASPGMELQDIAARRLGCLLAARKGLLNMRLAAQACAVATSFLGSRTTSTALDALLALTST